LRETGVPVTAAQALTADSLMRQLRPRGRLIRSAP